MINEYRIQADRDLPEDPSAGLPAVAEGEKAIYTTSRSQTLTRSPSLYELFPTATWALSEGGSGSLPVGYFEFTDGVCHTAQWDDPEAALVMLLGEESIPTGIVEDGERAFLFIDEQGTVMQTYAYIEAEDLVQLDTVEENPLIGSRAEPSEHESWRWAVEDSMSGGSVEVRFAFDLTVYGGSEEEGREVLVRNTVVYKATEDIPEDPGSGRPAIPAGSEVTYYQEAEYLMRSSEGPFSLFPDAEYETYVSDGP